MLQQIKKFFTLRATRFTLISMFSVALLFSFFSCEDEEIHEHQADQSIVKKVNLSDVPELQSLINTRKRANKDGQDSITYYLERINTEEITLIETLDGVKNYTFSTQISEEGKLTNFIIQDNNSELTYTAIKYIPENWEQWTTDVKNGIVHTDNVEMEINNLSKFTPTCWVLSGRCPSGRHDLGSYEACDYKDIGEWTILFVQTPCTSESGGGTSVGGGATIPSTSYGNEPTYTNTGNNYGGGYSTINTLPNICTDCPELTPELDALYSNLTDQQATCFNNLTRQQKGTLSSYLNSFGSSVPQSAYDFAEEAVNTMCGGGSLPNDTLDEIENTNDAIVSILTDITIYPDNDSNIELPPSYESFNFTSNGTTNWQQAAVKNIKFRVVVVSPDGLYVNHDIRFSQAVLFGMPKNTIGYGDISSGMAAELSAAALQVSMNETVALYGNQMVTEAVVRYYFIERLKYNYAIMTGGGRVNFNVQNCPVIPTQYKTNLFGTGSCD